MSARCFRGIYSVQDTRIYVVVLKILRMISLPYRRHVLSFQTKAALGYHVHLYSKTPFIFGDEETIMSNLTKVTRALVIS